MADIKATEVLYDHIITPGLSMPVSILEVITQVISNVYALRRWVDSVCKYDDSLDINIIGALAERRIGYEDFNHE